MRNHRIDRGLLAVEFLPDHGGAARTAQHIRPRRVAIGTTELKRTRERPALVVRARIEQPLARLASGVPSDMIGARRCDRKARTVMRACGNLPVVVADATHLARR